MSEQKTYPSFNLTMAHYDLNQLIKSIGSLVEEATIEITNEGLMFRGLDPSHVCMLDIALPNAMFEKYDINQEGLLGFKVDDLQKLVKELDKKTTVKLEATETHLLKIKQKELEFNLRLIEVNKSDFPLPKIPYDARIDLNGYETTPLTFIKHLKRIHSLSDYVTIQAYEQNFILSAKSDAGDIRIQLEDLSPQIKQESESSYSLEYMMPFLQTLDRLSNLTLEYSSAKPLRLETKLANIGRIHFYLAPRVEN